MSIRTLFIFLLFFIPLYLFLRIETTNFDLMLSNLKTNGNVLSCYDCFHYARITEDYGRGDVEKVDHLRNAPDFVGGEYRGLVYYLPSFIQKVIGIDYPYIYLFAPFTLAILFIIPAFFWIRSFGDIYMFTGFAFLGVMNSIYWVRTAAGRYDTDFLILFFVFLILYVQTRAILSKDRRTYLLLTVLTGMLILLFMSWYYKPIFTSIFLTSHVIASFLNRKNLKEMGIATAILFVLSNPLSVVDGFLSVKDYFSVRVEKESLPFVPFNVHEYIWEGASLQMDHILKIGSGYPVVLGFFGFLILLVKRFRELIPALPIFLIGLTAIKSGNRFTIYLMPFIGLGIGYVVGIVAPFVLRYFEGYRKKGVVLALLLITAILSFSPNIAVNKTTPLLPNTFYESFKWLRNTEEGAFVWTWWDFGYPIEYLGRKATYIDNGNFHTVKMYAVAHSFSSRDPSYFKQIVSYITNTKGTDLIYKDKTYKDFISDVRRYTAEPKRDVYVLVDSTIFAKSPISKLGNFGILGDPKPVWNFSLNRCLNLLVKVICPFGEVNLRTLEARFRIKIRKMVIYDREKGRVIVERDVLPNPSLPTFYIFKWKNVYLSSVILPANERAVIVRMFFFKEEFDEFQLVHDNFPWVVIYKVKRHGTHNSS